MIEALAPLAQPVIEHAAKEAVGKIVEGVSKHLAENGGFGGNPDLGKLTDVIVERIPGGRLPEGLPSIEDIIKVIVANLPDIEIMGYPIDLEKVINLILEHITAKDGGLNLPHDTGEPLEDLYATPRKPEILDLPHDTGESLEDILAKPGKLEILDLPHDTGEVYRGDPSIYGQHNLPKDLGDVLADAGKLPKTAPIVSGVGSDLRRPDFLHEPLAGDALSEPPSTEKNIQGELKDNAPENMEKTKVQDGGGSYKNVREYVIENGLENMEVHHMPADSVSPLERSEGPCIAMDESDHKQTASYGNSKEAREYREEQKTLIDQGKFEEAFEMDVEDVKDKFGDKYDAQIAEAKQYMGDIKDQGLV